MTKLLEIMYSQLINADNKFDILYKSLNSLHHLLCLENKNFIKRFVFMKKYFDYILYLIEDHPGFNIKTISLRCLKTIFCFLRKDETDPLRQEFKW